MTTMQGHNDPTPRSLSRIPVFYAPEQVAEPQGASPSANKPRNVVGRWKVSDFPIDLHRPQPVAIEDFYRAHDRTYVDDVLARRTSNGFGNRSVSVAASLPWTSGSMLSAARHALASGSVACAPCSGFHHAHWDAAAGFCTFNGLMVTCPRMGGVEYFPSAVRLEFPRDECPPIARLPFLLHVWGANH